MSEYQYYEFRAIDRPLTGEEQKIIGKLSSRVDLSPYHASFVYHYSDLPARAEELLARYFDAMFYIANWGSCQLMFRFPKNSLNLEEAQRYCPPDSDEEFMSLTKQGEYIVLNIEWHQEEPEWGWIEGEGWLPRLMGLRDDILRGDYRLLYLAWLKAVTLDEGMFDEFEEPEEIVAEVEEPPVPPGLRQLSPGLRTFIELFELDEHLVTAAAEVSGSPKTVSEAELRRAINQLSREACENWLLRLAQGEFQLATSFNRELSKWLDQPQPEQRDRRTIDELLAAAERIEEAERKKQAAEAQAKHLKKMETIAAKEAQLWQEVMNLIGSKSVKAYDQAVEHLKDLSELAKHRGEEVIFQARLNKIYQDYRKLSGLTSRLRQAKMFEM